MEQYLGLLDFFVVVAVLLGIGVIEFVSRRIDKRKQAEAGKPDERH